VTSANLDLVRSIYEDWERGDWSSLGWTHPEIEVVWADGPTPGTSTGVAGMADRTRDFLSAWEGLRAEAEEFRELDAERVLVLDHSSGGSGKTSGLEVAQMSQKGAHLFHIRGGKVTRLVIYLDRELAFADLGLRSQPGKARP
jgi:ketosteroid isomerase-like protein